MAKLLAGTSTATLQLALTAHPRSMMLMAFYWMALMAATIAHLALQLSAFLSRHKLEALMTLTPILTA